MNKINSKAAARHILLATTDLKERGVVVPATVAKEAVAMAEKEAEERHQYETRWRSVEEELPKLYEKVLVKRNPDVFGGNPLERGLCYLGRDDEYDGETVWIQSGTEQVECRITHWKPID